MRISPQTPDGGSAPETGGRPPREPGSPDPLPEVDSRELQRKSLRGGMVTLTSQGAAMVIQITSTVVLARLLSPEDYGVMGMVMAIVSFAGLFRDLGLSSAAIQKKNLTRAQQSNLFWINVGMGSVLTCLVAAGAPLVVAFYGRSELLWVTVALSFSFVIASLGTQHGAMLVRKMHFGRNSGARIAGSLSTLAVAVTLALNGYSYWALVWGYLTGELVTTVLRFAFSPFRPGWVSRRTGIRDMLGFGANVTAFDVVNYFARNLDKILIGRFVGAGALGLYSRAYQLLMFPITAIRGPIQSVAFPAMSKLDSQSEGFRSYYLGIVRVVATISMPLTAWFFVAAEDIVLVALGQDWLGIVPIFKALALASFVQPVSSMRGLVLMSSGQGRKYLTAGLITSAVVSAGFAIGVHWGALGVAISYAASVLLLVQPMHVYCSRGTSIGAFDLINTVRLPVFMSAIGVLVMTVLPSHLPDMATWHRLVLGVLVFATTMLPGGLPLLARASHIYQLERSR